MTKTWNVSMIGMGYWSDVHFHAWRTLGNVRIAAVSDRNQHKLDDKAAKYGLSPDQLYLHVDDMLKRPDIDIVDVITRPDSHLEMVERAARAGKHVLCQKPFAPTLEESQAMVDICRRHGVRLMVAEGWRWQSHYIAIKQAIDSGVLGAISFAKIAAKWYFTPRFDDPAKMTQPYFREMDRLLLYEMGPHYIDAYRYLFGQPSGLTAVHKRISPHIMGDDLAILIFHHGSMTGMLEASWASREFLDGAYNLAGGENLMEYVIVEGADATLRLTADGKLQLIRAGGRVEDVDYPKDDLQCSHDRLHAHFIHGLNTGEPFATSGEEYLQVMRIIEQAYSIGGKVDPIG